MYPLKGGFNAWLEAGYPLEYIVTTTTRPKRAMERDNADYHFISKEIFQEMMEKDVLEKGPFGNRGGCCDYEKPAA